MKKNHLKSNTRIIFRIIPQLLLIFILFFTVNANSSIVGSSAKLGKAIFIKIMKNPIPIPSSVIDNTLTYTLIKNSPDTKVFPNNEIGDMLITHYLNRYVSTPPFAQSPDYHKAFYEAFHLFAPDKITKDDALEFSDLVLYSGGLMGFIKSKFKKEYEIFSKVLIENQPITFKLSNGRFKAVFDAINNPPKNIVEACQKVEMKAKIEQEINNAHKQFKKQIKLKAKKIKNNSLDAYMAGDINYKNLEKENELSLKMGYLTLTQLILERELQFIINKLKLSLPHLLPSPLDKTMDVAVRKITHKNNNLDVELGNACGYKLSLKIALKKERSHHFFSEISSKVKVDKNDFGAMTPNLTRYILTRSH